MKYKTFNICGKNLGRHPDFPGSNRICYGRPGHAGGHGNDDHPGQAELLMTDDQLEAARLKNEKDVKKQVKKLLDRHNWFWWMTPANGYGVSGISDFLAFRGGTLMAIETKFGSNKPTALQKAFLGSITAESGFGFVVNDKNIEWFEAFLNDFDSAGKLAANKETIPAEDGARMMNAMKEMMLY